MKNEYPWRRFGESDVIFTRHQLDSEHSFFTLRWQGPLDGLVRITGLYLDNAHESVICSQHRDPFGFPKNVRLGAWDLVLIDSDPYRDEAAYMRDDTLWRIPLAHVRFWNAYHRFKARLIYSICKLGIGYVHEGSRLEWSDLTKKRP